MQITELIDKLNVFNSSETCTRWKASGAVKINGSKVNLGENIQSIQIGNKNKLKRNVINTTIKKIEM